MATAQGRRVIGLWLPDWPVQAAWISGAVQERTYAASMVPIALFGANGVVDCSSAARRAGVRRGQARRHAQAICPNLITIDEDPARDAQEFEPVLERVEAVAAGVEALRPGLIVVNAYAPTRYYGSEEKAMELLLDATALPGVDCSVGVADDIVTAVLAARRGASIPTGQGKKFRASVSLAELSAEVALSFPEQLGEAWLDLGLHTLGDVARIPARDMATRFGVAGAKWRSIAECGAVELVSPREAPADLLVVYVADEVLTRVDMAAFAARTLAVQLHEKLRDHGLSCYRLAVSAVFDDQHELRRVWRCANPLDEATTADRVRWQLDGWMNRRTMAQQVGRGIVELRLEPLDVVVAGSVREALWGGADDASDRALRAATRVQSVLGTEAVTKPVLAGGRGPVERVYKVPVGEQARPDTSLWAGAVPAPNPAMNHPAASVQVLDREGNPVVVTGRATLHSPPALLVWGAKRMAVTSWAGPWPVDERWWSPETAHRAARLQVVVAGDANESSSMKTSSSVEAFLLIGQKGKWRIEGRYA